MSAQESFQAALTARLNERLYARLTDEDLVENTVNAVQDDDEIFESEDVDGLEFHFENAIAEGYDLDVGLDDGETVTLGESEIEAIRESNDYKNFFESCVDFETFSDYLTGIIEDQETK